MAMGFMLEHCRPFYSTSTVPTAMGEGFGVGRHVTGVAADIGDNQHHLLGGFSQLG